MVDTTKYSKRYTNTQIAEQLNRPETEGVYKHPNDRGRVFTAGSLVLGVFGAHLCYLSLPAFYRVHRRFVSVGGSLGPTCVICQYLHFTCMWLSPGNVQAFLKKMFPSEVDTQAGVNALERAKTWPGWGGLDTKSEIKKNADGKLSIHRVTITLPMTRWLLEQYGDFILIDCTFKLTIYVGRYTIIISVIDRHGHVHPIVIADVPGMSVRGMTGSTGVFGAHLL